nr:MAG TPA: hypothetical protein [Caudoviricetes sp.]
MSRSVTSRVDVAKLLLQIEMLVGTATKVPVPFVAVWDGA